MRGPNTNTHRRKTRAHMRAHAPRDGQPFSHDRSSDAPAGGTHSDSAHRQKALAHRSPSGQGVVLARAMWVYLVTPPKTLFVEGHFVNRGFL